MKIEMGFGGVVSVEISMDEIRSQNRFTVEQILATGGMCLRGFKMWERYDTDTVKFKGLPKSISPRTLGDCRP